MLELTRELIEHYLRATGWTLSDGEWAKQSDDAGYQHFSAEWIDTVGGLSLDVVVRMTGHSAKISKISFQLGLCAAAEHERGKAEQLGAFNKSRPQPIEPGADWSFCQEDSARETCDELLALAGIDPKVWEAARKQ